MRQLGQLQKHVEDFKKLNAELIFVFREERSGVEGLKKIQKKNKAKYTLALDLNKESSAAYSPRRMTFDNFVIGADGTIAEVIDGTLKDRATADEIIKVLKILEAKSEKVTK